jgi:hypothetical protein
MVDRWNGAPYTDEGPHPDGPMVYYSDYRALELETSAYVDKQVARIRELETELESYKLKYSTQHDHAYRLQQERRELEAEIELDRKQRQWSVDRIAELEAFLNLCYEEKMVPTSDDLDALKVPVSFSDSSKETKGDANEKG